MYVYKTIVKELLRKKQVTGKKMSGLTGFGVDFLEVGISSYSYNEKTSPS